MGWTGLWIVLLGFLMAAAGALLFAWGLLGDWLQGNRKRARCPKCAYDLSQAPDGATAKCPECGWTGNRRALFRSRRRWRLAGAGLVMTLAGVILFLQPVLSHGQWTGMLPQSLQVRMWPYFNTQWRMRQWANQVASGAISGNDADPYVAAARRGLSTPGSSSREDCLSLLTALKIHDDDTIKAAAADLTSNSWTARQAAIQHLRLAVPDNARLVAIIRAAYTPPIAITDAREIFDSLDPLLASDADVRALMLDIALDLSHPLSSSAVHYLQRQAPVVRNDLVERLTASKNPALQDYIAQNLLPYSGQALSKHEGDLLRWALARVLESQDQARQMSLLSQAKDLRPIASDLDAALAAGKIDADSQLWDLIARLPTAPPAAFAAALKSFKDENGSVRYQLLTILAKPAREQLPHILELEHHPDWRIRRAAAGILASLTPRSDAAIEALRRMESSKQQPEEVRVAARDGLRRMGLWPSENGMETPAPSSSNH